MLSVGFVGFSGLVLVGIVFLCGFVYYTFLWIFWLVWVWLIGLGVAVLGAFAGFDRGCVLCCFVIWVFWVWLGFDASWVSGYLARLVGLGFWGYFLGFSVSCGVGIICISVGFLGGFGCFGCFWVWLFWALSRWFGRGDFVFCAL